MCPVIKNEKENYIVWTNNGIYGSGWDIEKNIYWSGWDKEKSTLWHINPKAMNLRQETLATMKERIGIIGIDPSGEKMLLGVDKTPNDLDHTDTFWVFDIQSRMIVQELPYKTELIGLTSNSIEPPTIGFRVTDIRDRKIKLYIYDWENGEIIDTGQIQSFIGWRSNVNGFLVVKKKEDQYWLELIKP